MFDGSFFTRSGVMAVSKGGLTSAWFSAFLNQSRKYELRPEPFGRDQEARKVHHGFPWACKYYPILLLWCIMQKATTGYIVLLAHMRLGHVWANGERIVQMFPLPLPYWQKVDRIWKRYM